MATRTGLAVGGIVRVGGSFWGSGETWSLGRRLQLFLVRLPILVASRGWIEDAMPPTLSPVISGGSRETRTWLYAELLQLKTVWERTLV